MKKDLATITVQIPEATRRRLKVLSAETGQPIRALVTRQIDHLLTAADSLSLTQTLEQKCPLPPLPPQ